MTHIKTHSNVVLAGVVTRKNGVYLNSDVNRYFYQVTVKDAFNSTSDTGLIRINIEDDSQLQ